MTSKTFDINAVSARLAVTREETCDEHDEIGYELGIEWASEYATEEDLAYVANSTGRTLLDDQRIAAGGLDEYAFLEGEDQPDEDGLFSRLDGFAAGAREVWKAVQAHRAG